MSCDTWNHVNSHFCEIFLYTDDLNAEQPEYVNAFSAFFGITFCGIIGTFQYQTQNVVIRLITSLILMNGIFSGLYHYYLYNFFGNLDVLSMLFAAYLGCILVYDELIFGWSKKYYNTASSLLVISFASACVLSISSLFTIGWNPDFTYIFATPFAFIVASFPLIWKSYGIPEIRCYLIAGSVTAGVAAVIWLITEPNCRENRWMAWLFGHAIWHIGSAYGLTLLCIVLIYIDDVENNRSPVFVQGSGWFSKTWYKVFPKISYNMLGLPSDV